MWKAWWPLREADFLGLPEPVDQQGHGGHEIAVVEQGLDQQRVGLRRAESLGMLPPEGDIARRRARLFPQGQRGGDLLGGLPGVAAGESVDVGDFGDGETVPPQGQLVHAQRDLALDGRIAGGGGLAQQPGLQAEQVVDRLQQLVDAVVGHAVFDAGKAGVLPAEPQDIPGVDHRAAFDRAMQQRLDVGRQGCAAGEIVGVHRAMRSVVRHCMSHRIRAEATRTVSAWRRAGSAYPIRA